MPSPRTLALCLMLLPLAACGRGAEQADPRADRDPAVSGALSDPIMTDPDLASQNQGGAALAGGGPASGEIPKLKQGAEEVAAAHEAALAVLGGTIPVAPGPSATAQASKLDDAATLQAMAEASGLAAKGCPQQLGYSYGWAAKLPPLLAPYPRGHVRAAAGTDDAACKLRVVSYLTPAPLGEVIDFHHARAVPLGVAHRREGGDDVLSGGKGAARFALYARRRDDGFTQVDVITSGF